jgi:fructose-bisphosphate aldolase class I
VSVGHTRQENHLTGTGHEKGVFGTRMRSVIKPDEGRVKAVVDQQFETAGDIIAAGLVPIIEPEVDIHSPQRAEAEMLLKAAILEQIGQFDRDQYLVLKLTVADSDDFYAELVNHPNVLRVVALSGGYSRVEADASLARKHGVVASFSRALTERLSARQSDEEFDAVIDTSIASIFAASVT